MDGHVGKYRTQGAFKTHGRVQVLCARASRAQVYFLRTQGHDGRRSNEKLALPLVQDPQITILDAMSLHERHSWIWA